MLRAIIWLVCVYFALALCSGCADQQLNVAGAGDKADGLPDITAKTYYAAGLLHEKQGNLEVAVKKYHKAIDLDPTCLAAYNRLGIVYDRMGQYAEAERVVKWALAASPRAPYLHNNLAFTYMLQHRYRDAEAELRNALSVDPGFSRAKMNLGIVLAKQGQYDQGLELFLQVCQPHEAHYNIGLLYHAARRYTDAEASYRRAIDLNPQFAAAREGLARIEQSKLSPTIRVTQATGP